jgi:glucose/arabinose dehydrogenase
MCQAHPQVYNRGMRLFTRVALGTCFFVVAGCHHSSANGDGGSDGGDVPDMAAPPYYGNCTAPARPPTSVALMLTDAFPGRTFTAPLGIVQAPGDAAHFYVWEQGGTVRRIDATGTAQPIQVADVTNAPEGMLVSGGEAGLLGLAFSPKWQTNHIVYLSFTPASAGGASGFKSFIARMVTTTDGTSFDVPHEQPVLSLDQPFTNHNGGNIIFGPDGYLYFGLGDGGDANDPFGNGQNKDVILGKMLRLKVGPTGPYGIPPDNPFAAGGGRPEIFAYGLRNPWRWSFDRATGELWVGDVGQNIWEEIDIVQKGGNYGWNIREASSCRFPTMPPCEGDGSLIDPIWEYEHDFGWTGQIGRAHV